MVRRAVHRRLRLRPLRRAHILSKCATARNSAHLPLPREARAWQNSPARGLRGVKTQENNSRKYPVNLWKNPVNLSNFIEFFGNSVSEGEATGSAMIPESPESARTANAGKCAPGLKTNPPYPPLSGG